MMEDFDIYADLPSFHADECENDNKENVVSGVSKKFEEKNEILEKEIGLLKTKVQELEGVNNKLKSNFSSLMKTAKAEISRKDRTISDLRAQLDNFTFRRNPGRQNNMHVQNNHYVHCAPPPTKISSNHEAKKNQAVKKHIYQAQSVENEFSQRETNPNETWQNRDIKDKDSTINNNPEYRNTIYGERLRKKLEKEMESERRKKEEEMKMKKEESQTKDEIQKKMDEAKRKLEDESIKKVEDESQRVTEHDSKKINECFDKVNNKENLALINEAAEKVAANIKSEKTSDVVANNTDFVKNEVNVTKKIDYLESKNDQCINRKGDIPKVNKSFVVNGNVTDTLSKNHSNNYSGKRYNDSSVHKDYRNRDDYNYHDRHRHSDALYIDSDSRHSRKDRYYNQFEKNDRHKNLHRYKSRDRERSSSSSTKDDLRKKHSKSEDKHNHITKTVKLHKKDKEIKHNPTPKQDKLYKRDKEENFQSLEISKKHKEHKIKTPKRKRRSESEEKIVHKTKRNKLHIKTVDVDKISTAMVKRNSSESKESIQDELSRKHVEHTKESSSKLNKVTVEDKHDKMFSAKKYNDKLADNVKYVKDKVQLDRNVTNEIEIDDLEQKKSAGKQEVNQRSSDEKVTNNNLLIVDETNINKKFESHVELLLNDLEEGEIVDSAYDELQYNCRGKQNGGKIETVINKKTTSKLLKIQENDEITETLNSCRADNDDSSETDNDNSRSLMIIRNTTVDCAKSVEPKKDEYKSGENRLLFTLLTQNTQPEKLNSYGITYKENKETLENAVEKGQLDAKFVTDANNPERSHLTTAIDTKPIVNDNNEINSETLVANTRLLNQKDNCIDNGKDCKLQIINSDEITNEEDTESHLNEKNVENIVNIEVHKDDKAFEMTKDEVKNSCIESIQNINDDVASQNIDYEEANINNYLSKEMFKSSDNLRVASVNDDAENGFQKKTLSFSKLQAVRNVIIVRRRRRPVQLSDSPPVLIIPQTGVNKST